MKKIFVFCLSMGLVNIFALRGKLQCDSSALIYEISLSPKNPLSKNFCLLCHIKYEDSDDESESSEGSYTVKDSPWLHKAKCRDIFLEKFSQKIREQKGGLPSLDYIKGLVGDIEKLSNISITSGEQFLKINKGNIETTTSLKFEGITLNEDFFEHFCEIIEGEFDRIEFSGCRLEEGVTFAEILDSCNVTNLSIIDCSISDSDLAEVLIRINPYCIKNIDLSENVLEGFTMNVLEKELKTRLSLNSIKLEGTGLDATQLKNLCHE